MGHGKERGVYAIEKKSAGCLYPGKRGKYCRPTRGLYGVGDVLAQKLPG